MLLALTKLKMLVNEPAEKHSSLFILSDKSEKKVLCHLGKVAILKNFLSP
jgi:hypothetical protein